MGNGYPVAAVVCLRYKHLQYLILRECCNCYEYTHNHYYSRFVFYVLSMIAIVIKVITIDFCRALADSFASTGIEYFNTFG
jgi:hypothetical protein